MPYFVGQSVKWLFYKDRSGSAPDVREGVIIEIRGIRAVIQSGDNSYLVHFSVIVPQPVQLSGVCGGPGLPPMIRAGRCFQLVCSGVDCSPALAGVGAGDSCQLDDIEIASSIRYNSVMSAKPQFQIRFPELLLEQVRRWAELCGLTPSEFIMFAILAGSDSVLSNFGVLDKKSGKDISNKVTNVIL